MPKQYDMREVIHWIRPKSRYQWLSLGANNYNSIGEWFGPESKPTEQEILNAWNEYVNLHSDEWALEDEKISNQEDVDARFLISQLANKSPQEIYTAMQTAMDNWTSLADAKADLREWLPLMAAIIAWKVQ